MGHSGLVAGRVTQPSWEIRGVISWKLPFESKLMAVMFNEIERMMMMLKL
jgi:hypothetical protein